METFFLTSTVGYIDRISKNNPRTNWQWVSSNISCIRNVSVLNNVPEGKIEAEFDQNVKASLLRWMWWMRFHANWSREILALLISRIESGRQAKKKLEDPLASNFLMLVVNVQCRAWILIWIRLSCRIILLEVTTRFGYILTSWMMDRFTVTDRMVSARESGVKAEIYLCA